MKSKKMKSLNDYIIESKLEENILKRLYFHTCVEFKLNNNLYPYVIESLGKFYNAGKVVKHIIYTLKDNFESQTIDCTDDKVYFKYINIELNNVTQMDNFISIHLFCKQID